MFDLFEIIKSEQALGAYIESETSTQAIKVGEGTYRINPCPFCQHHDCFTVYDNDQNFYCFSCKKSGDIISFERLRQNLQTNGEAALFLAKKLRIKRPVNMEGNWPGSYAAATLPEKMDDESISPPEKRLRLTNLRGFIAKFYHEQLMANEDALEYQVGTRGHCETTLKKFWVGYVSGKSIIQYAKDIGHDLRDFVKVGCVKETNGKYSPTIPYGFYVYPHILNGEVLYFTIKDPEKRRNFQIKKRYADPAWTGFNQDVLGNSEILIVEGEDDCLSVDGKASFASVYSICGNFNNSINLKTIEKIAKDKIFNLAFDSDTAGRNYGEKYSKAILNGGGKVRIIDIPASHKDIDEFLSTSPNPSRDLRLLIGQARLIEKFPERALASADQKILPRNFGFIRVVGEEEGGALVIESEPNRKLYSVSLKDLTYDKCLQIGGAQFKNSVYRNKNHPEPHKISFIAFKENLIMQASKKQLGQLQWLGQGTHYLKNGNALIVNGGEVFLWNDQNFRKYSKPIIDTFLIRKEPGRQWIADFNEISSLVNKLNAKKAEAIRDEFIEYFSQWGLAGGHFDTLLIVGWCMAQVIQTVWDWRCHLWIRGQQGSGKTLLLESLTIIGGRLAKRREGHSITEAGVRQDIGEDACLYSIDEFERSTHRMNILKLMRGAGHGGVTVKGTPGQKSISFRIKHMIVCASIEMGMDRAAEKNRFLVIETIKDARRNPTLPDPYEAEKMTIKLFAYALWAAQRAKEMIKASNRIPGYDTRLVSSFKVPVAMLAAADKNPSGYFESKLKEILDDWEYRLEGEIPEDEERLYAAIMSATIRVSENQFDTDGSSRLIYVERCVSQMLFPENSGSDIDLEGTNPTDQYLPLNWIETLAAHGIKRCQDGIFYDPEVVKRKLLKDTQWGRMNIGDILKRIQGATAKQRRIAGRRPRGIMIPFDYDRPEITKQ